MNRSKSVVLQKNLPFTQKEFRQLKVKVDQLVRAKEQHRYCLTGQRNAMKMQKSFSMVPSLLHCYLNNPHSQKQFQVRSIVRRCDSVDPCLRFRNPTIKAAPMLIPKLLPDEAYVESARFKWLLGRQPFLCRTCQVDRAFKPKLFKRRK